MQPSDGFWEGVGSSVGTSPGWLIVIAMVICSIVYIVAKHIVPAVKEVKLEREKNARELREKELDIRQREAENDSDRIKANAALAEQYRQTNVLVDGMRQSLDASTAHTDVLVAELRGSRDRSRAMGEELSLTRQAADHIKDTTDETNDIVKDIRRHIIGPETTD